MALQYGVDYITNHFVLLADYVLFRARMYHYLRCLKRKMEC
jgi:hypothetical protein